MLTSIMKYLISKLQFFDSLYILLLYVLEVIYLLRYGVVFIEVLDIDVCDATATHIGS